MWFLRDEPLFQVDGGLSVDNLERPSSTDSVPSSACEFRQDELLSQT
jgi:hypothetical protein